LCLVAAGNPYESAKNVSAATVEMLLRIWNEEEVLQAGNICGRDTQSTWSFSDRFWHPVERLFDPLLKE